MDKDKLTTFDDETLDQVSGGGPLADAGAAIGGFWDGVIKEHFDKVGGGLEVLGNAISEIGKKVNGIGEG